MRMILQYSKYQKELEKFFKVNNGRHDMRIIHSKNQHSVEKFFRSKHWLTVKNIFKSKQQQTLEKIFKNEQQQTLENSSRVSVADSSI